MTNNLPFCYFLDFNSYKKASIMKSIYNNVLILEVVM